MNLRADAQRAAEAIFSPGRRFGPAAQLIFAKLSSCDRCPSVGHQPDNVKQGDLSVEGSPTLIWPLPQPPILTREVRRCIMDPHLPPFLRASSLANEHRCMRNTYNPPADYTRFRLSAQRLLHVTYNRASFFPTRCDTRPSFLFRRSMWFTVCCTGARIFSPTSLTPMRNIPS
jgi:hypothetical protein